MMFVRTIIICSLVLWNQCNPHVVSRDIDNDDESVVEELKMAKTSDSDDELNLLQFAMFGKPYSFKLIPANTIFSPNFEILQQQIDRQIDYQTIKETGPLEGSFYTDQNGRGSFYIQHKNGEIQLDGFVDDTIAIRYSKGLHKATKTSQQDYQIDRTVTFKTSSKSTSGNTKLQNEVATVEILVFLDQIVHNNLVERKASIKKYLGIFWNTVQNKYEIFSNPKIRFSLSGVIILSDMKWMSDVFIAPNKPNDEEFIKGFAVWLYKEKQVNNKKFPLFDVGVLHTGLDLSFEENTITRNTIINTGTLGIAPTGAICVEDPEEKMFLSICVVEDFYAPTFGGSIVASHEIGHLLKARHDDTELCDKHGIMSPYITPVSVSTKLFCNVSVAQIKKHLDSATTLCLFDSPHPNLPIGPEVPAMTRDEICKMAYGGTYDAVSLDSYKVSTDPCVYVLCTEGDNYRNLRVLMWVPERTSCGDDKVCIKGKCTTNNRK